MDTVKVEIAVGKETKEVIDALVELVADIRAKKEITLIASENLQGIYKAIEGVDQVGVELKSDLRNETISYAGLKIADALAPDEVAS